MYHINFALLKTWCFSNTGFLLFLFFCFLGFFWGGWVLFCLTSAVALQCCQFYKQRRNDIDFTIICSRTQVIISLFSGSNNQYQLSSIYVTVHAPFFPNNDVPLNSLYLNRFFSITEHRLSPCKHQSKDDLSLSLSLEKKKTLLINIGRKTRKIM